MPPFAGALDGHQGLGHFETAWGLLKADSTPSGRRLGGMVLANWADLLSSLGRLDKLKELVTADGQWPFADARDRDKFQGAVNSYYLMQRHPEMAYRCGTFALKAVGGNCRPPMDCWKSSWKCLRQPTVLA